MKLNKQIFFKTIVISISIIIIFFFYKCPTKLIFGIDCPGCGMTRAYKALLRLDFVTAFHFHPLFPLPAVVFVYEIFKKKLFIGEKNERIVLLLFSLAFFVYWIIKIFL